jgi:hypothetical protein
MTTKENKPYLVEDQDLIDRLKSIGPMSTGQVADQQKYEISCIQIESTLRNRKSMDDYDKNSGRFSKVLGLFAIIQLVVAIMQFALDASSKKWIGFGYVIILGGMIIWMLKVADRHLKD